MVIHVWRIVSLILAPAVGNIPIERFEEQTDELAADLGLVVDAAKEARLVPKQGTYSVKSPSFCGHDTEHVPYSGTSANRV